MRIYTFTYLNHSCVHIFLEISINVHIKNVIIFSNFIFFKIEILLALTFFYRRKMLIYITLLEFLAFILKKMSSGNANALLNNGSRRMLFAKVIHWIKSTTATAQINEGIVSFLFLMEIVFWRQTAFMAPSPAASK